MPEYAIHTEKLRVHHHECNAAGFLKTASLLDYFQDAAACHAEELGFGMTCIAEKKMIWVLSRLRLAMDRMPELGEELTIETYPDGFERVFALRQYALRDAAGKLLVRASSDWLLVDMVRMRPLIASRVLGDRMPLNTGLPRFFSEMPKLAAPETLTPCADYRVLQGDIDLNRHLNNAVYARFITDALGLLGNGVPQIRELQIVFQHAGVPGGRISCAGALESCGTFYIEGNSPDSCCFQAAGKVCFTEFRS